MYEGIIQDVIDALGRLPGVGPKGAQRIAFHLLKTDPEEVTTLATALLSLREKVRFCEVCGNVSQAEQCAVCRDPRRDPSQICVVEESKDVVAIERTREFRGRYHVLGEAISPMDGIGPDDLRIRELLERVAQGGVEEVILATNPDTEGDATAMYLSRLLKPFGIRITRLGFGVPVGSNLEYADDATMLKALEGRREM